MTTVGCSEGHNATPWTTHITDTSVRGLGDSRGRVIPHYEAIQCAHAPMQGRSGGGLYTRDGFVAGVCNFQEPHAGHGLYASPRSIYRMLDKNKLTICYNPAAPTPETLLADRPTDAGRTKLRAQNPTATPRTAASGSRVYPIPSPEMVGSDLPRVASAEEDRRPSSGAQNAWQAVSRAPRRGGPGPGVLTPRPAASREHDAPTGRRGYLPRRGGHVGGRRHRDADGPGGRRRRLAHRRRLERHARSGLASSEDHPGG